MNINGSIALVTGGNRGLGACLVDELLRQGASKVYLASRGPVTVDDPRVQVISLDVTEPESVEAAAKAAPDVTLLVNNAGVLGFGSVLDGDLDLFERDMRTNYMGALRVARAFLPALRHGGDTAIVNVLTLIALAPAGPMAGYSASKAAAHSMTQALRSAVAGDGVQVVGAYPGGIDTDMLAGVEAEKADPRVVASRIVAGVARGDTTIWPDDASAGAGEVYLNDPARLERMLAG
ncbi:SDR family NAD(P)-dependent oxidoreductase [Actinomadura barringtoniae]|uniref:SDR family NAD(P)-dependent oxidoreductase n=1 Tax=Actinomadura barringtoniae TaxID=1427535 RepID=A0A939P7A1_9ACTN|nr:SDR family NAD(P)-dependent oxidoreductase [Actinomadura barringtoniae]MBO2446372.1 SDR family NAD(P)-dependent oxidoreductase [Actinomadura barringtoniae]